MAGDLLTRDDIIRGLRDLVVEARRTGATGRIHLVGGAALALRYFERRTTSDVDASIAPGSELLDAARTVAIRNGWDSDWLNTNATMFVPFAKDLEWETLYEDERVVIRVASPQALLAMKLNAGRRGRDDDDIEALMAICGVLDAEAAEELFEEFYAFVDNIGAYVYPTLSSSTTAVPKLSAAAQYLFDLNDCKMLFPC